jgi:peptidoglycan/LPS O-acetylase OafA/YrhL
MARALATLGVLVPVGWFVHIFDRENYGDMPALLVVAMFAGWAAFGYAWGEWLAAAVSVIAGAAVLVLFEAVAADAPPGEDSGSFLYAVVFLPIVYVVVGIGVWARRIRR